MLSEQLGRLRGWRRVSQGTSGCDRGGQGGLWSWGLCIRRTDLGFWAMWEAVFGDGDGGLKM